MAAQSGWNRSWIDFHKKVSETGHSFAGRVSSRRIGGECIPEKFVARSRPCWLDQSICLLISSPTDYSFPSGHTLSSTIGATILTKTDRRFGYAAIPLAVLIAISRLYLYVHFPSDILGAAILGVMIGELTLYYGNRVSNKLRKI